MTTLITDPIVTKPPGQQLAEIVYPESDGKRMSDNTKQARWILGIYGNLCAQFQARADVFVAADNLWYPVQGEPETRTAPDVYVVFGRPKGDRGSYQQWLESDIPLTVVFEILSPGNDYWEMIDKFHFYDDHGVEEYYIYDPDRDRLDVYLRGKATLTRHLPAHNFVSPRMGIRFDLSGAEMVIYGPDGKPFRSFEQMSSELKKVEQQLEQTNRRAERLAELSRKALRGQASAEELQELNLFLGESS